MNGPETGGWAISLCPTVTRQRCGCGPPVTRRAIPTTCAGRGDRGYTVTFAIPWLESGGQRAHVGGRLRFDLVVNEMLPGRTRRAGQLVWSGGNGWVFLQGDRQDPARFGVLELVG